jgi:hypothetical protein
MLRKLPSSRALQGSIQTELRKLRCVRACLGKDQPAGRPAISLKPLPISCNGGRSESESFKIPPEILQKNAPNMPAYLYPAYLVGPKPKHGGYLHEFTRAAGAACLWTEVVGVAQLNDNRRVTGYGPLD